MILKIVLDDGRVFGLYVYENNFDGEIQVNDTFKLDDRDIGIGFDDVFGTNEQMLTVYLD